LKAIPGRNFKLGHHPPAQPAAQRDRPHPEALAPGPIFAAEPHFATCVRISCGLPWNDEVTRGIKTLGEIAHEL
jgi:DNA-binding transcriptional MocR family regulator